MWYKLTQVSDFLFIDELQDALFFGGITPGMVAKKFNVDEERVLLWLSGRDLPPLLVQHAVLNWLAENIVE